MDVMDDDINDEKYPCHTQSVERTVKIVTEASQAVCGQLNRDGFIHSRLEGRRIMPFSTQRQNILFHSNSVYSVRNVY